MLCDVDQTPPELQGKSTPGLAFPTQLTHGTVFLLEPNGMDPDALPNWKIATGQEHFQAMGFNFLYDKDEISPLTKAISDLGLTRKQMKKLSGNAMHLRVQAAWMAYCLGHTAPRPRLRPLSDLILHSQGKADAEGTVFLG